MKSTTDPINKKLEALRKMGIDSPGLSILNNALASKSLVKLGNMKPLHWAAVNVLILIFCVSSVVAADVPLDQKFIKAIHMQESSGKVENVKPGDNGRSIGPLQIQKAYWIDSRVPGSYEPCTNLDYSIKVMTAYLNRYAKPAVVSKDYETLARIHNGGPKGAQKKATLRYWTDVRTWFK